MDQFDAFQYFLTNLFLHNLVLVVLAGALGTVLGRLIFGTRKVALDQLREALKEEEDRARALGRKWKELQAQHEELLKRVEAGDTSFSPEQERELEELRNEKAVLVERERGMAKKLEEVAVRQQDPEAEKGRLEKQVAEADAEQGARAEVEKLLASMQGLEQRVVEAEDTARQELEGELGALRSENERLAAELAERGKVEPEDEEKRQRLTAENERLVADLAEREKVEPEDEEVRERLTAENERLESELEVMRQQVEELEGALKQARQPKGLPARRGSKADMETLEQRVAETLREREQVEKASAVLRKEMRGLRNKVKAIEQQVSREEELEQLLKDAEDRLTRSQATVAKESRVRTSLEKMVEDLEGKLAGSDGSDEPEEKDDLTRIKGIGAVLEKKLHAAGVTRLRQIAEWTDEELAEFSTKLGLRNRAERGDWRGQARALCDDE